MFTTEILHIIFFKRENGKLTIRAIGKNITVAICHFNILITYGHKLQIES